MSQDEKHGELEAAIADAVSLLGSAGIQGASYVTGQVLSLIGRIVEALGSAGAGLDPAQFLFLVGTSLIALNYFDQTEPYATIIRKLKLHDLIKQLHAPGTQGQNIQVLHDAVDCCITEYQFAGLPVPANIYALRDTSNVLGALTQIEKIIPGAGILDSFMTEFFNAFGIKTAAQLLGDAGMQLRAFCRQQTKVDCAALPPTPPPTSIPPITQGLNPSGLYCLQFDIGTIFTGFQGKVQCYDTAAQRDAAIVVLPGTHKLPDPPPVTSTMNTQHRIVSGPYNSFGDAVNALPAAINANLIVERGKDGKWYVVDIRYATP